ncbi:ankyrin repeat-containing domain protein, partial [Phaeosphaeriaceae sp. PMI808]
VRLLLACDEVDCNLVDECGRTPLSYALGYGRLTAVQLLFGGRDPGLNVNIRDHRGRTPLLWCIARHSYRMAMLLLSREDVELGLVDENEQGLLIWAAKWGRLDLIEIFLAK